MEAPADPAARPPGAAVPSTPPNPGPDEIIFQGSVSLWLGWRALSGAGLAILVGLAAALTGFFQPPYWSKQVFQAGGMALCAAGLLLLPYLIWRIRSLRYTITTRLIEREEGLFFKRVDSLDLGRVKDVELSQAPLERLARVGTLKIFSSDATDPVMRLEGIPNPRPIYEKLRDAVIRLSQRRGYMALDR